jgi:antitoxin component YwqK of YwqJK toxin-antitoxin module
MNIIYKENTAIALFGILLLALTFIFCTACEKDHIPKSDLMTKDSLIYKKGSDTPFTGREKARVEDKIIEYDVVDGIKHGDFLLYYEDGTIQIKGTLDSNRNVGKWQYFYQDGKLESEGFFVDDMPEGRWSWFYPSGNLKEDGSYHKGLRVGWWKQYDEIGNVIFETEFTDSLAAKDSLHSNINKLPF